MSKLSDLIPVLQQFPKGIQVAVTVVLFQAVALAAIMFYYYVFRITPVAADGRIAPVLPQATTSVPSSSPAADQGSQSSRQQPSTTDELLQLKARDGRRPLLDSLYGFHFDRDSQVHRRILVNILQQIRAPRRQYGLALDIDTLRVVKGKAPLVCRDVADLEVMLQNQLEIYDEARGLILGLFGLSSTKTYGTDPLLRQVVADYESKIRTSFRDKGVALNVAANSREEVPLRLRSAREVVRHISASLEVRIKMGITPGPSDYDVSHVDAAFVPTGGYNIL